MAVVGLGEISMMQNVCSDVHIRGYVYDCISVWANIPEHPGKCVLAVCCLCIDSFSKQNLLNLLLNVNLTTS